MSSHHIVRDEQEPALLVLNPHTIRREILDGLLEWSPTVIANESGAITLHEWGIKVDYVLSEETHPTSQLNYKKIHIEADKLAIASTIAFLQKRNYHTINIIGNPQHEGVFQMATKSGMEVVLFESDSKQMLVRSGSFSKWYPKNLRLSILPMNNRTYLTTKGFSQNLNNDPVTAPIDFETDTDGIVKITSNLQPLILAEYT